MAGITQLYIEESPLVTGPLVVEHVPVGPPNVHVGAPVGATEPVEPVIVPAYVMIWPLEPVD